MRFPDEECVLRLAGAWSVDPSALEQQFRVPGLEVLGKLPNQTSWWHRDGPEGVVVRS